CASKGETATRVWLDIEAAIAWRSRCQPAHRALQPVGNSTKRVVIEGGHLARIDRAIGTLAVPAFPDSGGSHRHRIEPRGAFALGEQAVGSIILSNAAQRITDERRA